MRPELSIIIVSWNVRELLIDCLASIYQSENTLTFEVIVVENASSDGTEAAVRKSFPQVNLVTPGHNTGFTAGNNIGMEASSGKYILLLNPDTKVIDSALSKLVEYMEDHLDVGAVGPQLLNADGTIQSSKRRFPSIWTAIFESTWLQPIAPRFVLDEYYVHDKADDMICEVDWVQGAALLVRRQILEDVGNLDEAFFMYSEELDWQRRIKNAGWKIIYYPDAKIIHYGGKSSEQIAATRHIYFQTSKVRYFWKHHGLFAASLVRIILLLNYIWQLGLEGLKWLIGHKRQLRSDRLRAYWQVLQSGLKD